MEAPADSARILIVEDEPKLASLMADYLAMAAFRTEVIANGLDVVPAVRANAPDLVLLDLMLPGRDGLEVCRELRSFSDVPIVMVTARIEEVDRLVGLGIGADDYICKPFRPREVVARVQAILRRVQRRVDPGLAPGRLVIDEARHLATLNGHALELTPVEFRLLKTLAAAPGRVFSRQQLLDHLYADHRVVGDRAVDTHIKNLRRSLQRAEPGQEMIESVYGVGYKLVA